MSEIEIKQIVGGEDTLLKLFEGRVQAGFPSPVQGEYADTINLNKELIATPAATFCARVMGDSMIDCGINEGDMLIIDKSLKPKDGNIAVCFVDGEFTVKRIRLVEDGVLLVPGNKNYPTIKVTEQNDFQIWGVVSHIIKKV